MGSQWGSSKGASWKRGAGSRWRGWGMGESEGGVVSPQEPPGDV